MVKLLNKKVIVVFILSLLILILSIMFYIVITTTGIILKPNIKCNFRDEVYLKDYIYKLDGVLQNNHKIDTNYVGEKELKIIYKNKYGFYKTKKFNIEIKDITPPTILVNNDLIIEQGYEKKIEDRVLCADDYDDDIKCELDGSYNLEQPGTYPLSMTATDKSNNSTTKKFNLVVTKSKEQISNKESLEFVSYEDIYKKYKNNNNLIGVDISKWQEEVDFKKIKENNVEFVMLKLGGQKDKGSKLELDPTFKNNIEEAQKEGLKVGIYFYSHASSIKEAKKQASFVLNNIKNYNIDLPIAFDWENWTTYNSYNISFNSLNNIAKAFMNEIKSSGYKTLLYSSEYYLDNNIWFYKDYKNVWLANYGKVEYLGNYDMWQLCSDGRITGINTYVDIDILYLN